MALFLSHIVFMMRACEFARCLLVKAFTLVLTQLIVLYGISFAADSLAGTIQGFNFPRIIRFFYGLNLTSAQAPGALKIELFKSD